MTLFFLDNFKINVYTLGMYIVLVSFPKELYNYETNAWLGYKTYNEKNILTSLS